MTKTTTESLVRREWNTALDRQRAKLQGPKYSNLKSTFDGLSFEIFEESLEKIRHDYESKGLVRAVRAINQYIPKAKALCRILDLLSTPLAGVLIPCSLVVWSATLAVIRATRDTVKILEIITEQLADMSDLFTTLGEFEKLLPNLPAFNVHYITRLIEEYVSFCISTTKYLMRPIGSALKSLILSTKRKFRKTSTRIDRLKEEFYREATLHSAMASVSSQNKADMRNSVNITQLSSSCDTAKSSGKIRTQIQPQNMKFRGRTVELARMEGIFDADNSSLSRQKSLNIYGPGGIGKTELAKEFIYRSTRRFQNIYWIRADTGGTLEYDMAQIAASASDVVEDQQDNRQVASTSGRDYLQYQTNQSWLLVFDNVNNWADIKEHWPRCNHGNIIITSQTGMKKEQEIQSYLPLEGLHEDEATELLMSLTPEEYWHQDSCEVEFVKSISKTLGGYPLYLAQVAGYMDYSKQTPSETLSALQTRNTAKHILERDDTPSGYHSSPQVLKQLRLNELSEDARKLLNTIAMLNPDGVPEDLLFDNGPPNPDLPSLNAPANHTGFNELLPILFNRHLISRQRGHITMHRSVQVDLLNDMLDNPTERQRTFDTCVDLVQKAFPAQSSVQFPQNDNWHLCHRYSSQIIYLLRAFLSFPSAQRPVSSMKFAILLSDVSNYFWEKNIFKDGLEAINAAENICEEERFTQSGEFLTERAHIFTLAASLRTIDGITGRASLFSRFAKAVFLRQEQINIRQTEATENDVYNYANAWGNMANVYLDLECYEEAALYAEFGDLIKTLLLAKKPYECVVACYEVTRNRSIAYVAMGRIEEALSLVPKEHEVLTEEKYQASLLAYYHLWANIYLCAGNQYLKEARRRAVACLEKRLEIYGPSNRGTLDSYYLMAIIEESSGNLEAAERYLRKAFLRPSLEWPVENYARAQYLLGSVITRQRVGDQEARECFDRANQFRTQTINKGSPRYLPASVFEGRFLQDGPDGGQKVLFDHMVSIESGKPCLGRMGLAPIEVPVMSEICRMLKGRLEKAGTNLSAGQLSALLFVQELDFERLVSGGTAIPKLKLEDPRIRPESFNLHNVRTRLFSKRDKH